MKSNLFKVVSLALLVAVLALAPASGFAQPSKATNAPAAENKDTPKKGKRDGRPGRGKVDAIDKVAKTVTVGDAVLQVTSETRIRKNGKPATLDDGVVGEAIGYFVQEKEGKLTAFSIRFGPPVEGAAKAAKKEASKQEAEKKKE
jgi:hypothetical protein